METAFDVAETKLGIARLLDPEDVDVDKPDEKSIMTYVAQFLHKYPEPKVSFCFHLNKYYTRYTNCNTYNFAIIFFFNSVPVPMQFLRHKKNLTNYYNGYKKRLLFTMK